MVARRPPIRLSPDSGWKDTNAHDGQDQRECRARRAEGASRWLFTRLVACRRDWIAFRDERGWNLISPDGKTVKLLGKIVTPYLAFSRNGKLLYGIQTGETEADQDRATLFSLDPVTLKQKVIKELGKDLRPESPFNPGLRFSMAPDGKSFVYPTPNYKLDLWMLRGYRQPAWWSQISDALRLK